MNCAQFLEELSDFLDEAPDGVTRAELERHLSKCPDCRVIRDTTRKTVRVFKGLEPCPVPPQLEACLLAALQEKSKAAGS